MIGVGDALGETIAIVFLLSSFSLVVIPILSQIGLKRTGCFLNANAFLRIVLLILSYVVGAVIGQVLLIQFLKFGILWGVIWIIALLLATLGFNQMMKRRAKDNTL